MVKVHLSSLLYSGLVIRHTSQAYPEAKCCWGKILLNWRWHHPTGQGSRLNKIGKRNLNISVCSPTAGTVWPSASQSCCLPCLQSLPQPSFLCHDGLYPHSEPSLPKTITLFGHSTNTVTNTVLLAMPFGLLSLFLVIFTNWIIYYGNFPMLRPQS